MSRIELLGMSTSVNATNKPCGYGFGAIRDQVVQKHPSNTKILGVIDMSERVVFFPFGSAGV